MSNNTNALSVLSKHGKSFRFAGHFLSKEKLEQAARLYAFCRYIDDIADESSDKTQAYDELCCIQTAVENETHYSDKVDDFVSLKNELNINSVAPLQLIEGVKSDLSNVAFANERELIRYCYRVAGVVGLMMCPILGANEKGYGNAINLGIAMQLTNISRDVMEDAQMGRRYLPATWCNTSAQDIVKNNKATQQHVIHGIQKALSLSEFYYASGWKGLPFLPKSSRSAIAVAGSVYRQIGIELANVDYCYWKGRVRTSSFKKLLIAGKILTVGVSPSVETQTDISTKMLHTNITDLMPFEV